MTKNNLLFLIVLILFQGCNDDNGCEGFACFTPPTPFVFELVDKATKDNIFKNEIYDPNQIEVINSIDNSAVGFDFINNNDEVLIQIYSIGWQTEKVNVSVKMSNNTLFTLYVDAERVNENCCTFTRYNDIQIQISDFEFDSNTGIYRILL